ncbi:hypothetical protein J6590_011184 [Homalodisca vitripennis]|nr:hypothetical protein J6590_011184 [Homalodisca vitripennis]
MEVVHIQDALRLEFHRPEVLGSCELTEAGSTHNFRNTTSSTGDSRNKVSGPGAISMRSFLDIFQISSVKRCGPLMPESVIPRLSKGCTFVVEVPRGLIIPYPSRLERLDAHELGSSESWTH